MEYWHLISDQKQNTAIRRGSNGAIVRSTLEGSTAELIMEAIGKMKASYASGQQSQMWGSSRRQRKHCTHTTVVKRTTVITNGLGS